MIAQLACEHEQPGRGFVLNFRRKQLGRLQPSHDAIVIGETIVMVVTCPILGIDKVEGNIVCQEERASRQLGR
ncbi:hypothetical protein GCM10009092_22330 [Bowmanella denitrificans]|uniref:Uncharacterized protein n=1 Tax=Bowmanella denitrificans TaxID=366582 RepID=A0ABN0X881_9ALTE